MNNEFVDLFRFLIPVFAKDMKKRKLNSFQAAVQMITYYINESCRDNNFIYLAKENPKALSDIAAAYRVCEAFLKARPAMFRDCFSPPSPEWRAMLARGDI